MTLTDSEKADAGLVGHIIILSITMVGISMIALVGIPAIYSFQDMATVRNAEQTYTMLDSLASKVALGEANVQSIDIDLKGGSVSLIPNSTSQPSYILFELSNGTNITRIPVPMGKIMYRLGERDVAYEGGGVWTKYPSGSVMLSPPEFNFNGVTLTFPIVNVSGNFSAGGKGTASLKFEKKNSTNNTKIIYPTATYQNPLDQNITTINITIKSEYYDAWADYFRSTILVNVNTYPSEKKVVVTLEPPPLFTNFSYGALASESILLKTGATSDSYNSSKEKYSIANRSNNGTLRATNSITVDGKIYGDAMTAGIISGSGEITRDAYAQTCCGSVAYVNKKSAVGGMSLGNTIGLVQGKINTYKTNNDNNNPAKSGNCLKAPGNTTLDGTWSSNPCTMRTGNYYLIKFYIPTTGNTLIFDTSSGPINIALDSADIFYLKNNNNLTVSGNNPVRLYMNTGLDLDNGIKINPTTNDKSSLFQIISSTSQDITIANTPELTGFIWAPKAKVEIKNTMIMKGAIVAKSFILWNNFDMHYDEALQDLDTDVTTGEILTYLYITQNEMVVSMIN